jgi:hypothetical protein
MGKGGGTPPLWGGYPPKWGSFWVKRGQIRVLGVKSAPKTGEFSLGRKKEAKKPKSGKI